MTDIIGATIQLDPPVEATIVLDDDTRITAAVVAPPTPIVASITVAGERGPAGAEGPAGHSSAPTVFTFTNQATWTVPHNLGRYPSLELVDNAGAVFDGDIEFPDLNTAVITHASPMSGSVLVS